MKLSYMDKQLLQMVQTDFPLVPEPYKKIADRLGTTEAEVRDKLHKLQQEGIIRRLGGIFDSRMLGYTGTLCALKVSQENLHDAVAVIDRYPEVTHNYLRNFEYNVWFTVLAPSWERVNAIVNSIQIQTGQDILNLPAQRVFKINVRLDMQNDH